MRNGRRRRAECLGIRLLASSPPSIELRTARRPATGLVILSLWALALLPPGGMTLCFGHDGHMAVSVGSELALAAERAGAAHCPCDADPSTADPGSARAAESDPAPAHAPCDDLPIEGPLAKALPRTIDSGEGAGVAPLAAGGPFLAVLTPSDLAPSSVRCGVADSSQPSRHSLTVAPALTPRQIV